MELTAAGAGRVALTNRQPVDNVVAVSDFNHPLNLIVHQVAPAVATGCPVLVKPADDIPLSCQAFFNILYEAGLPEEWCRFVPCDIPTAEQMVTESREAFFSFIRSAKVGWMLRLELAPGTRGALVFNDLIKFGLSPFSRYILDTPMAAASSLAAEVRVLQCVLPTSFPVVVILMK